MSVKNENTNFGLLLELYSTSVLVPHASSLYRMHFIKLRRNKWDRFKQNTNVRQPWPDVNKIIKVAVAFSLLQMKFNEILHSCLEPMKIFAKFIVQFKHKFAFTYMAQFLVVSAERQTDFIACRCKLTNKLNVKAATTVPMGLPAFRKRTFE